MSDIVIVAYRPKPGEDRALLSLLKDHAPTLRRLGLATDRPSVLMQAADGTFLEVFEWKDGAIDAAHEHPDVQAMWAEYATVCDYVPLNALSEASDLFAGFRPAT